jgi:hypothetical protein
MAVYVATFVGFLVIMAILGAWWMASEKKAMAELEEVMKRVAEHDARKPF